MKWVVIALVTVLNVAQFAAIAPARADFAAGAQAYDGGDYETAHAEWIALANSDDAEAQVAIAGLYRLGAGRDPDMVKAAYWYRRAAEQGFATAQTNLGILLSFGITGKRDYNEAFRWFLAASLQCDDSAQTNLSLLFANGLGAARNPVEADACLPVSP